MALVLGEKWIERDSIRMDILDRLIALAKALPSPDLFRGVFGSSQKYQGIAP